MGNNRVEDDDLTSGQRSKRRASAVVAAAECVVCKPHEPTEDEARMSTLCQAALDNDPGEHGQGWLCA